MSLPVLAAAATATGSRRRQQPTGSAAAAAATAAAAVPRHRRQRRRRLSLAPPLVCRPSHRSAKPAAALPAGPARCAAGTRLPRPPPRAHSPRPSTACQRCLPWSCRRVGGVGVVCVCGGSPQRSPGKGAGCCKLGRQRAALLQRVRGGMRLRLQGPCASAKKGLRPGANARALPLALPWRCTMLAADPRRLPNPPPPPQESHAALQALLCERQALQAQLAAALQAQAEVERQLLSNARGIGALLTGGSPRTPPPPALPSALRAAGVGAAGARPPLEHLPEGALPPWSTCMVWGRGSRIRPAWPASLPRSRRRAQLAPARAAAARPRQQACRPALAAPAARCPAWRQRTLSSCRMQSWTACLEMACQWGARTRRRAALLRCSGSPALRRWPLPALRSVMGCWRRSCTSTRTSMSCDPGDGRRAVARRQQVGPFVQ